jgi:hypothetical protein
MTSENTNIENQENDLELNSFVPEVDYISEIASELQFDNKQVSVVLELI